MDIILYNIGLGLLALIFGYLFGSIPFAIIIGKVFFHQDPREVGSKNAGATNMGRTFGKKIGVLVFILDVLKAIAPIWICWAIFTFVRFDNGHGLYPTLATLLENGTEGYILQYPAYFLAGLGVCLGHCFPLFAKFKGGKGAATLFSVSLTTAWMYSILPIGLFVLLMKKTKKMSLCVIICNAVFLLTHWIFTILILCKVPGIEIMRWLPGYGMSLDLSLTYSIVMTACYVLCVVRHRENIRRLINHEERTINLF